MHVLKIKKYNWCLERWNMLEKMMDLLFIAHDRGFGIFFFFFGSKWIKLIKKIENLWGLLKKRKECERKEWWRAGGEIE